MDDFSERTSATSRSVGSNAGGNGTAAGESGAEYGRGRFSLWTGDLGVAAYVNSCLTGTAAMPTLDGD